MISQSSKEAQATGFSRRIKLHPTPGVISAGLEDDFHRFVVKLNHADGVITDLDARAERYPWSTCPDAGAFLAEQAIGKELETVAGFDPYIHCTHLFELIVLCAAHALDTKPTQFDLFVADRTKERTFATLCVNGDLLLRWDVDGTMIEAPDDWAGRDLRKLSTWKQSLIPIDAERAMLMRRVIHIPNGRGVSDEVMKSFTADLLRQRIGACFRYQMPRALEATQSPHWRRDFSLTDDDPLQGFDPEVEAKASRDKP